MIAYCVHYQSILRRGPCWTSSAKKDKPSSENTRTKGSRVGPLEWSISSFQCGNPIHSLYNISNHRRRFGRVQIIIQNIIIYFKLYFKYISNPTQVTTWTSTSALWWQAAVVESISRTPTFPIGALANLSSSRQRYDTRNVTRKFVLKFDNLMTEFLSPFLKFFPFR